ncbi:MAG: hypothetical protein AB1791_17870 [Chloroflexota bacterium]
MNHLSLRLVVAIFAFLVLVSPAAAGSSITAEPATAPTTLDLTVPVNVVFVGFDRDSLDLAEVRAGLPTSSEPAVRAPRIWYGLEGRDLGIHYDYRYRLIRANRAFENDFFAYLSDSGVPGEITDHQQLYNDEDNNILEVTGPVLYVDAVAVEGWLADNAHRLGIRTQKSYTVFYVNWYAHPDFQFHVYEYTDEPDLDTGMNLGEIYDYYKLAGWGGTSSRIWFYDFSAGPTHWGKTWNVDDSDVNGDGLADYRMPVIWEYAADGFRDPAVLSSDLGKLTRYVAVNLLFTPSPLYDPLNTTPGVGGSKIAHLNMLEDVPESNGLDFIHPEYVQDQLEGLQPYYDWGVYLQDHNPIDPAAQRALLIFNDVLIEDDCWNTYGYTFAELFCFFDGRRDEYIPTYGASDYVVGGFAFQTTTEHMGAYLNFSGLADDNWVDGTQSFVYSFVPPPTLEFGYAHTLIMTHELGHHFGLSHPHDGYDYELGLDYDPTGDYYFAWLGDESQTVMNYIAVTSKFGQFDRDNINRWETVSLLQRADQIMAAVGDHPAQAQVNGLLDQAAGARSLALGAFGRWEFEQAAGAARVAYEAAATAAEQLGISLPERAMPTTPTYPVQKDFDPVY